MSCLPPNDRSPWYLVQTKPNAFRIAERNLLRQRITVFCPVEKVTQRHGTRFREITRQLFTGYLFVRVDPANPQWRAINSTYGVSRLVTFAGTPGSVPNPLVMALHARCDQTGLVQPPESLKTGDRVRITAGPFANFVATVENIHPDQRVAILLDILGGKTRTEIQIQQLQSA
ncbi:transcription termination/antitermination protein NusG [Cereibacter sphaeroides]|uniref:transcription termination/antitermination protein NusG n=1 Tax=Cereibacter sphaeroides TaxID=1063 RepID=UPI001F465E02|nr:transcription termination/antitermination NusG family protein [Cereibacter sphaeroides]MCE6967122.1 transcriptional activator RfaH [Cereibacter sphaeroides]